MNDNVIGYYLSVCQVKATNPRLAVVSDNYETELQNLMRGMSIERKDIEGAFRLEIADLEQRHLDQLIALKKESEKEKVGPVKIIPSSFNVCVCQLLYQDQMHL